jgi:GNAT superfamily N-acetyltransferase
MTGVTRRPAAVNDAADIHTVLLKVAADIPLAVETLEHEEALYAAVRKLLAFGESWVAVEGDLVVGFALVENVETRRHWGENEMLALRYAGVDPAHRDDGTLDALISAVLERTVPIVASVKEANRSGLAARLERLGFRLTETSHGELHFWREPGIV